MVNEQEIEIEGKRLTVKNLNKLYDKGVTKAMVIEYYVKIAPLILPHIINKPFSMVHYPDGVGGKSFFQKRRPENAPEWLDSVRIESGAPPGYIDWCLVNDTASLVYMANRGVTEMHTWFSRLPELDNSDVAVLDVDPSGATTLKQAIEAAKLFEKLLSRLNLFSLPLTSGSRGIHIYIPLKPTPYSEIRAFCELLCLTLEDSRPDLVTTERTVSERGDRVYLDYVQIAQGKTIAAPYSLRIRPGIPVSTPLRWSELKSDLVPADFNIFNIDKRLKKTGDLTKDFYSSSQTLPKL